MPTISVIMPVFNAAPFLREAMDSILRQDHRDLELVVVDDASTDGSLQIAQGTGDSRVNCIGLRNNGGVAAALNEGIRVARGTYIARMDGDDLSVAGRISAQVRFLNKNPAVDLVGSYMDRFGGRSAGVMRLPKTDAAIKMGLAFGNCIAHPTVMMRRSSLPAEPYSTSAEVRHAEDYDLWTRLAKRAVFRTLPKALVRYRLHSSQSLVSVAGKQGQAAARVRTKYIKDFFGLSLSDEEERAHAFLCDPWVGERPDVSEIREWAGRLHDAAAQCLPSTVVRGAVSHRWLDFCNAANVTHALSTREYFQFPRGARIAWGRTIVSLLGRILAGRA